MVNLLKLFITRKSKQEADTSSSTPEPLGLKPLHPEEGRKDNAIYVEELKDAIAKDSYKNIALTGGYGSGKSSILTDFTHQVQNAKKKRVIQISLAALGGDRVAQKGTLPDDGEKKESGRIQKEIVKQLLFKEAPVKVPESKFKRIGKPYKTRIILFAVMGATFITSAIYFFWGSSILYPLAGIWFAQIPIAFSIALTSFSLIALMLFGLHGNFVIEKLTGGPVSLAVSKGNNYFDQYLDELIYFFEATDYDIVIFEDIERFDNAYIFVALKQLNSILNDAGQIIAAKKQIRFIYAIKDSLFSKGEFASYEQSTNRAKFFDLIISVVPFVTHQSSTDIMTDIFITKGKKKISKELIATVSKYITDMRLIKNIYNEYLVFENKILGKDKLAGLTPDKLLAMVVYKNTNLEDFENIKLGKSRLEKVYSAYRRTISNNVTKLNEQVADRTARIENPQSLAVRNKLYGDKLISFLQVTTSALRAQNVSYALPTGSYTLEQMRDGDFWEALGGMGFNDNLTVSYRNPQYSNVTDTMTLSRDTLEKIVGGSLNVEQITDDDITRFKRERTQFRKDVKAMRYKTLHEILSLDSSDEFRKEVEGIIGKKDDEDSLTYDLLEADYIDANFVLYTSVFHGTNPRAANFLIHHLQTNRPDLHYKFKSEGVDDDDTDANIEALLTGSAGGYLRSKSIYNVEIIDYLLRTTKQGQVNDAGHALYHITENLKQGEQEDRALLDEYIRSGKDTEKLIGIMSSKWPEIFEYIAAKQDLPLSERTKLVSAAIEGSNKEIQYLIKEDALEFITENASHIKALTEPFKDKAAPNISKVLPQFSIKLASFSRLSDDTKAIIISNNLYAINKKNLENATGLKDLALDNILESNENVFSYVVANLGDYLSATAESKTTKHTINSNTAFSAIVDVVAKQDQEHLVDVLQGRSDTCLVEDLSKVLHTAWPTLLDTQAVSPLSSSLITYYKQDESGALDQHLSGYLERQKGIVVDNENDEEELRKLAVAILSNTQIPPKTRSSLVESMKLKRWLAIDAFPVQNSKLYGYLLDDNIIEDSAATYTHLKNANPDTRHFYITRSHNFDEYINELTLDNDEIEIIATDDAVQPEAKRYIISKITAIEPRPSDVAIKALAAFATEEKMSLDVATLFAMIGAADTVNAVKLVNLSKDSFTKDGMTQILGVIGSVYARLAQKGTHTTLDDTQYNRQLAERLEKIGMASSITEKKEKIKINMKKNWQ